jgi:hypothetical protein
MLRKMYRFARRANSILGTLYHALKLAQAALLPFDSNS